MITLDKAEESRRHGNQWIDADGRDYEPPWKSFKLLVRYQDDEHLLMQLSAAELYSAALN